MDEPIRRPTTFPYCGRLIALPTSRSLQVDEQFSLLDQISIDFPAMPESIELARSTEYLVQTAPNIPDGIHMYKGTAPMEIPFSFKLHSFDDDYCPQGALTLLNLAARLHSFVLPISSSSASTSDVVIRASAGEETDKSNDSSAQDDRAAEPNNPIAITVEGADIFAPVTVILELMYTAADKPGISCVGYIKNVSVKMHGPFLRGPDDSYNLPSWAEFSFTFVHRPGHGNNFRAAVDTPSEAIGELQPQAFANWVKNNLFNTRALVQAANYRGFTPVPVSAETREQAPQQTGAAADQGVPVNPEIARLNPGQQALVREQIEESNNNRLRDGLTPQYATEQQLIDAIIGND